MKKMAPKKKGPAACVLGFRNGSPPLPVKGKGRGISRPHGERVPRKALW